jgi:hypothetical protein
VKWFFGRNEITSGTSVDALIQGLRSTDSESCRRAARRAGDERCAAAVPALIEVLYRKDKTVIAAAAQALGDIGDLRAIQHLEEAAALHEFAGGIPGFDTFTEDGRIVEVGEEDAVMEKALREAEEKLWHQPGAGPYGTQLGKIRMHTFGDFWRSDNILIHPAIQNQPHYPFSMQCAKRFFKNFAKERFAFEGWVKSICVHRGKEALPGHSFADGHLLSKTLDELEQLGDPAMDKYTLGEIHFELGGNAVAPYVTVDPEPNWPRPSIVRRCVLDGRAGVRFDELP